MEEFLLTEEIKNYFIRINNRKNFIVPIPPTYHPASKNYLKYWKEEKRRCIEGYWAQDTKDINDKHSWRYMPGNLYFYVNHGTILHQDENSPKSAPKKKMRPFLRDVEWMFFYYFITCRGFSGFENDTEYSCNRLLTKNKTDQELIDECTNEFGEIVTTRYNNLFKASGLRKEYVDAKVYLKRLFDNPMGNALWENEALNLMMLGARGFGKDLEEHTLLHGKEHTFPIKDVKIGDEIYGADGKLTKVIERFDYNDQEQFELTLADDRKIVSGDGHLWGVFERTNKGLIYKVKELREIRKNYLIGTRKDARYFIPQCQPLEYEEKEYKIHPYVLGSLLGDGGLTGNKITFTSADIESINEINNLLIDGYQLHEVKSKYSYTLRKEKYNSNLKNEYYQELERLNLTKKGSHTKFIPRAYLYGSIDQRLSLLQGLLDTDGHINKKGNIEYCTVSENLKNDVVQLCRSLGIVTKIKEDLHRYRIFLKTNLPVFRLKRKLKRINNTASIYAKTNRTKLAIREIKSMGIKPSVCIAIDNKDKLFVANDFIVTHNSFMVGVGVVLYEILFDGAKYYNKETIDNPYTVELSVGSSQSSKSTDILKKVEFAMNNLFGAWGTEGDDYVPPPFWKEMSGTLASNNKKGWEHKYLKQVNGSWKTFGSGSFIKHITYTIDNPEAAVGGRPGIIIIEEVGLVSNLLDIHAANINCQREGSTKFGTSVYLGTGGNIEKIRESEEIFRNPEAYEFLSFDDIWEKSGKIGWFVPAYYSLNKFKDENGNTILDKAIDHLYKTRKNLMDRRASSVSIEGEMMSMPIVPSEMFLAKKGNLFPVYELRNRLKVLNENNNFAILQKPVDLFWEGNKANYKLNISGRANPIDDYPWDKSKEGCFVIYEAPITDENGKVPQGLYIFGHDPYAVDDNQWESLGSFFVLKTGKYPQYGSEELVAEYFGRPFEGRNAVNEIIEKAMSLYGATNRPLFFENSRGNTKEYFEKVNKLHLLCTRPTTVLNKTTRRITSSSTIEYGYPMSSKESKLEAVGMVRDWLLEEIKVTDDKVLRRLDLIPSRRLLKELVSFDLEGNFDGVMGFIGCIIGLRERENNLKKTIEDSQELDPLRFFNKNKKIYAHRTQN